MLRFVLYISMLVAVACSTYACVHLVINGFSSDRYDYCLWCPTSNTSLNASLHHFSSTHQSHFVIGSSLALRNISSRRLSDKTNHDFVTVGGFGLGYVETFNLLEERIRPSQTYIIPFQPYLTGDSTKTDHLEYHKFQPCNLRNIWAHKKLRQRSRNRLGQIQWNDFGNAHYPSDDTVVLPQSRLDDVRKWDYPLVRNAFRSLDSMSQIHDAEIIPVLMPLCKSKIKGNSDGVFNGDSLARLRLEHPSLNIIDLTSSGFPCSLFIDAVHTHERGAEILTDSLIHKLSISL